MNVLIIGNGAREYSIGLALSNEDKVSSIYFSPGNGATEHIGKNIDTASYQELADKAKELIKKRGSIVEHPFGTIRRTLGWDHFLVRSKKKVLGENALIMFTYNFRRLLNLIGIPLFKKLCLAIKNKDLTQITKDIEEYILVFGLYMVYFLFSKLSKKIVF